MDEKAGKQTWEEGVNALRVLEHIKYELNVAIGQLEDIGCCFGQKMDGKYLSK